MNILTAEKDFTAEKKYPASRLELMKGESKMVESTFFYTQNDKGEKILLPLEKVTVDKTTPVDIGV